MDDEQVRLLLSQTDEKVAGISTKYNDLRRRINEMRAPLLKAESFLVSVMQESKSLNDNLKTTTKNFEEWKNNSLVQQHQKMEQAMKSFVLFFILLVFCFLFCLACFYSEFYLYFYFYTCHFYFCFVQG